MSEFDENDRLIKGMLIAGGKMGLTPGTVMACADVISRACDLDSGATISPEMALMTAVALTTAPPHVQAVDEDVFQSIFQFGFEHGRAYEQQKAGVAS